MKLNFITFMVRDIEKTISFYETFCGLKILRRFDPGMGEIAFMADSESSTALELIQFDNTEKVSVRGMTMSFQITSSLTDLREDLLRAGYQPSEIINFPPKPEHFTVRDPDGIPVEFSR